LDDFSHAPLAFSAGRVLDRQENVADSVMAQPRQLEAFIGAGLLEEGLRDLQQDARPVAGVGFAAGSAAMPQVQQDRQGILDDSVRTPAFDVNHEADSAGIVLKPRVVKPLGRGRPRRRPGAFPPRLV
jgi:hypothetical protein